MARLTNSIRKEVIKKALFKAFTKKVVQWETERAQLGWDTWHHEYGQLKESLLELPAGWLTTGNHVKVRCDGFSYVGRRGGAMVKPNWEPDRQLCEYILHEIPLAIPNVWLPVPRVGSEIEVTKAHVMAPRYEKLYADAMALQADIDKAEQGLINMLWSVTTTERLLELWPEVKELLPAPEKPKTAIVPVDLPGKLNTLLGLPTEGTT